MVITIEDVACDGGREAVRKPELAIMEPRDVLLRRKAAANDGLTAAVLFRGPTANGGDGGKRT